MTGSQAVILFHTSNHALRAEKVLQGEGFDCRLVPVPRDLSSDCGVCLRLSRDVLDRACALLAARRVEVAATHAI
jgi:hypothetical protein